MPSRYCSIHHKQPACEVQKLLIGFGLIHRMSLTKPRLHRKPLHPLNEFAGPQRFHMHASAFHLITGHTPGLTLDATITQSVLQDKYSVFTHVLRRENLHLLHRSTALTLRRLVSKQKNVMIFFENISRNWMPASDLAVLVPNQEWMRPPTRNLLFGCHEIWCKTRYAERLFLERDFPAHFIGFSSRDLYFPDVQKDYSLCLHLCGRSELKGTKSLLQVWAEHPEWPKLVVVTRHHYFKKYSQSNIEILNEYLDQAALRVLMNTAGIHLCPSETEGFGHYINEALSTKAIVITTDAPPMNELVSSSFGALASYSIEIPTGFGERFPVDAHSLERVISHVLELNLETKVRMSNLARKSFLENRSQFTMRLQKSADRLTKNG